MIVSDIANRKIKRNLVYCDSLRIGKITYIGQSLILGDSLVAGIIGGDLLKHYVWKIDFLNQRIEIAKRIEEFDISEYSKVQFSLEKNIPVVYSSFNKRKIKFAIDTGASTFACIKNTTDTEMTQQIEWSTLLPSPNMNVFGNDTTLYESKYSSMIGSLNIGNISLEDEVVEKANTPLNLLGLDFCKRFGSFIIDYPAQTLYLGSTLYKSINYAEKVNMFVNTLGVGISSVKNLAYISHIAPKLIGEGLSVGDTILKINSQNILNGNKIFFKDSFAIGDNYIIPIKSEFRKIADQFHYDCPKATIEVKKGNKREKHKLTRYHYLNTFPDTLSSYTIQPFYPSTLKRGYRKYMNGGIYYVYPIEK